MAGAWWLFMHKVIFPSARAKNSENQEEDHDLKDGMEGYKTIDCAGQAACLIFRI
jgi:hypothetical protein